MQGMKVDPDSDPDPDKERLLPAAIICLSRNGLDRGILEYKGSLFK